METSIEIASIEATGRGWTNIYTAEGDSYVVPPDHWPASTLTAGSTVTAVVKEKEKDGAVIAYAFNPMKNGGSGGGGKPSGASSSFKGGGGKPQRPPSDRDILYVPVTCLIQATAVASAYATKGDLAMADVGGFIIELNNELVAGMNTASKPAEDPNPVAESNDDLPF